MISSFGMDLLLFGVITHVSMKFYQLSLEIENFRNVAKPDMASVRKIVTKHETLLSLNEKLENAFALSFLYHLVQSSAFVDHREVTKADMFDCKAVQSQFTRKSVIGKKTPFSCSKSSLISSSQKLATAYSYNTLIRRVFNK